MHPERLLISKPPIKAVPQPDPITGRQDYRRHLKYTMRKKSEDYRQQAVFLLEDPDYQTDQLAVRIDEHQRHDREKKSEQYHKKGFQDIVQENENEDEKRAEVFREIKIAEKTVHDHPGLLRGIYRPYITA
ncbi:MAG: hypothetical protein UW95_C0015G0027 [Parcubacteria group bacterium GW2011_GWC1_45_14]|nr:MAG: hypothetical protein UW95_C0015G0027 [Parcubacteria group bacterium GW2011_GWC1_45_14]